MEFQEEELYHQLPRHIRKLALKKSEASRSLNLNEGHLDLSQPISLWGTVGTDEKFNQYPDSKASKLIGELATLASLKEDQICVGNGSTELVDLVIRCFCNPNKDRILCFTPSNSRAADFARLNALEIDELELGHDFQLPIYEVRKNIQETTKLIFVENPNHITGSCFSSFDIVDLATNFDGIVLIDESAIDYASDNSLISIIESCDNVIVIQSFSRAWGLAGLPLGVAYANSKIIHILRLLKAPFSVNTMTQRVAVKALYVADQKERVITRTIEQREHIKEVLEKLPAVVKVHDSKTNTLLVEVEDAALMTEHLLTEEQLVVLNVSHLPGLENCLRITIGQGLDNKRLVEAFKDMPFKTSTTRVIWRTVTNTLKKASMYLGIFKKILGS